MSLPDGIDKDQLMRDIAAAVADMKAHGQKPHTIVMGENTATALWPRWHVCPRCQKMITADLDNKWVDLWRKWSWRVTHRLNCKVSR
jgi:hypothetical protein